MVIDKQNDSTPARDILVAPIRFAVDDINKLHFLGIEPRN